MQYSKCRTQRKTAGAGKLVAFALCLVQAASLAAGCAKTQAASAPNGPPLSVPAPPPRVLAPVDDQPVVAENPPTPEPAAAPPRTATRPPAAPPPRRQPTTPVAEPEP